VWPCADVDRVLTLSGCARKTERSTVKETTLTLRYYLVLVF
jgi:hypothetical protein